MAFHLPVFDWFISYIFYDKRDDFDVEIVNFPYLDGDVSRRASYGVYILQLIRFARAFSRITDLHIQTKVLTAKHLNHIINSAQPFLNFIEVILNLVSKFNIGQISSATRPIKT